MFLSQMFLFQFRNIKVSYFWLSLKSGTFSITEIFIASNEIYKEGKYVQYMLISVIMFTKFYTEFKVIVTVVANLEAFRC